MIFLTVGTQLPFDRLVKAADEWAGSRGRHDVFAQIGPTELKPEHLQWTRFLEAGEFCRRLANADVVVAHAGMGSIITAMELGKPILVMPRRAELGEHRNDHQLATAERFLAQGRITVAFDETELLEKLDDLDNLKAKGRIGSAASPELIAVLREFIQAAPRNRYATGRRAGTP